MCFSNSFFLTYFFLKSLYKGLYNRKWNSSSSFKYNVHFLSLNGIAIGFCHLPVSTFNLYEDILKRESDILNFSSVIHVRYGCSLNLQNSRYVLAREDIWCKDYDYLTKGNKQCLYNPITYYKLLGFTYILM